MRSLQWSLTPKHAWFTRRLACRAAALGTLGFALIVNPTVANGLDRADNVARIEEDWALQLNDPEPQVNAPQFHTIMSTSGDVGSYYFQVNWNFRDNNDFDSGGLQLSAWRGEDQLGSKSPRYDQLSTSAETITWTQAIFVNDGIMGFQLLNGSSQTWGTFGGSSDTRLIGSVPVSNLNNYSPDASVRNSVISYGANRVNRLRILHIRYYNSNGDLIAQDNNSRQVYPTSNSSGGTQD